MIHFVLVITTERISTHKLAFDFTEANEFKFCGVLKMPDKCFWGGTNPIIECPLNIFRCVFVLIETNMTNVWEYWPICRAEWQLENYWKFSLRKIWNHDGNAFVLHRIIDFQSQWIKSCNIYYCQYLLQKMDFAYKFQSYQTYKSHIKRFLVYKSLPEDIRSDIT